MKSADFSPRIIPKELDEGREDYRAYSKREGYRGLLSTWSQPSDATIAQLKEAGLRGRGGAAFPLWMKWAAMLGRCGPTYVIANGEEGEPGSFKDRELMQRRPHLILEGLLIACQAVGARRAYLYLGEGFNEATQSLTDALAEAWQAGMVRTSSGEPVEIEFFHVPHSYVAGEETAALQAIEGYPAKPRFKPPRPFEAGLFGRPTLIQNVETLACAAQVLAHGVDWYRRVGTEESPGTLLLSLAGDVERPGVYEVPFGTRLGDIIEQEGGGVDGRAGIRAILPGGFFCGLMAPSIADVPYSYEGLKAAGGSIGSANITVFSQEGCALRKAGTVTEFFARESCRQCGPCTNGTSMIDSILKQFLKNKGRADYIERLQFLSGHIRRHGACGHIDGAASVARTIVGVLGDELKAHCIQQCPVCAPA